jgi:hypothetical protein
MFELPFEVASEVAADPGAVLGFPYQVSSTGLAPREGRQVSLQCPWKRSETTIPAESGRMPPFFMVSMMRVPRRKAVRTRLAGQSTSVGAVGVADGKRDGSAGGGLYPWPE